MDQGNNKQEQENKKQEQNLPKRKNFFIEMMKFLWSKKAYWIVPVIIFLILFIFIIVIGTSPVSPFIYTII